jgi:organic hydroperoxide reductase OsmC/OhrA
MFKNLDKMHEELKDLIDSRLINPEFKLTCILNDQKKLKDCITEEFNIEEAEFIAEDPSRLFTKSVLTCLDSGLSLCIKQKGLKLEELCTEADFFIVTDDKGLLNIESITVRLNPEKTKSSILDEIKNCLQFYEKTCNKNSIKMPIKVNFEFAHY